MSPKKMSVVAHHEAGHAVIARKLGLGVLYIALFSTDETNNPASPSQSAAWAARDGDLSARAIGNEIDAKVCLAGPCTQQRYQPVKNFEEGDGHRLGQRLHQCAELRLQGDDAERWD